MQVSAQLCTKNQRKNLETNRFEWEFGEKEGHGWSSIPAGKALCIVSPLVPD